MITPLTVSLVEYVVDTSNAVNILASGLKRDRRGRPFNTQLLRTLLIGWLLTNQEYATMRIEHVHRVLTRRLDTDTQRRLGVLIERDGVEHTISRTPLDAMVRRLDQGLGYGTGTHPDLDDDERQRRYDVMNTFSDAMLDVFNDGFASTHYAIDASGIWTWGKSRRRRPNIDELDDNGDINPDAHIDETDPDAKWGAKTSKDGRTESVFGYHLHAMVRVPGRTRHGHHQQRDTEPRLVHRLGITPANADVVDVSLSMIDRLDNTLTSDRPAHITDLIVDSHYHYKQTGRWLKELFRRGVKQHLHLRADEVKFITYNQMKFLGGDGHCPATPAHFEHIVPLPPDPSLKQIDEFRQLNEERKQFAMVRHTSIDDTGKVRLKCPALAGEIGCPLRPGTVQAATQKGQPVLAANDVPSVDVPACCTQNTVEITLPEPILKSVQPFFWGSRQWQEQYNKRTYVESLFGNIKNQATENVGRGMHRHVGIMMNHLHLTLAATNFNLRTLRKWHQTTGKGNPTNPLLADITTQITITPGAKRGPRRPRWAA